MKRPLRKNIHYNIAPEDYDAKRRCWLNQRRENFISQRLGSYRLPSGAGILEIGSGTGLLLRSLAAKFSRLRFTGLEPVPAYVDYARRKNTQDNLQFLCGVAEKTEDFAPGPFSLVLSNDVLHHVSSLEETVESVTRVTSPGCRWLAIEPNCKNLYTFLRQSLRDGERNFWPGVFLRLARSNGWGLLGKSHLFLIPLFIKVTPDWMKHLERGLEGIPFLAGGINLELILKLKDTS